MSLSTSFRRRVGRGPVRLLGRAAAGFLLLGQGPAVLAQCAMCARSAEGSLVGRGLSISVLFLLGALALVVSWLVLVVIRSRPVGTPKSPGLLPSGEAPSS